MSFAGCPGLSLAISAQFTLKIYFTFIYHKGRTKEKKEKTHIKAHAEAHTQTQQY